MLQELRVSKRIGDTSRCKRHSTEQGNDSGGQTLEKTLNGIVKFFTFQSQSTAENRKKASLQIITVGIRLN